MKSRYLCGVLVAIAALFSSGHEAARGGSSTPGGPAAGTTVVKGFVRFAGTMPPAARVNMNADPSCAKLHPTGLTAEDIVVGADGGLQNVVVFISEGLGDRTYDLPQQPVVIEQKGCVYQPHLVAVRTNQELDVVNNDALTHNLHPVPANNREWNKAQAPGTRVDMTFAREEIAIPMKCNVHPWMRTYIAVFKHPYFAVTGKGGRFELNNLPPGNYTIQAWHEKLGTSTQKISVGPGLTKELEFIFKSPAGH
jgi:plastocyanin